MGGLFADLEVSDFLAILKKDAILNLAETSRPVEVGLTLPPCRRRPGGRQSVSLGARFCDAARDELCGLKFQVLPPRRRRPVGGR